MTELQKVQDQLNKALAELMKVNLDENELLYDYIFEAHRLVKKLNIPDVVKPFTAEQVLTVLNSSYELIDAKSFFEDYK